MAYFGVKGNWEVRNPWVHSPHCDPQHVSSWEEVLPDPNPINGVIAFPQSLNLQRPDGSVVRGTVSSCRTTR